MPTFDFTVSVSEVLSNVGAIVLILALAFFARLVLRRVIIRLITMQIPRIREESKDELARRSETLSMAITRSGTFLISVITFLMIVGQLGVNLGPIMSTVGLASLAVGFAAQNIVRDYLHGFFILMEDWYRVGEVATVAGIGGLVVEMSLRRTVLRDLNGTVYNIPNSKIELASNLTREWARINLDMPVAYGVNLDHVFSVINEVGEQMKADPVMGPDLITAPKVERVNNFGDSGIEIKILADTKPMKQWALTGALRKLLKERFDQEGIEIPWPHTKVYFGNSPQDVSNISGQ
ncbi:MAG: mechanosensitive ion channel family protein [Chloroflexi bacterium]|nr:mechanosensitive ion channel family protein [Chloroflexota bacterium]